MIDRSRSKITIDFWHEMLWSAYRGEIFQEIYRKAQADGVDARFIHITETDDFRRLLGAVDRTHHIYPYEFLFSGSYHKIAKLRLWKKVLQRTIGSTADLVLVGGFGKLENWLQALVIVLRGKKLVLLCASTIRDRRQTLMKSLLKRIFFSQCDVIFCYGERSSDYVQSLGVSRERIVTGCVAALFPGNSCVSSTVDRRTASIKPEMPPRYLYVGGLLTHKNVALLIRALKNLKERRPNATLAIVGDGPQMDELRELVLNLKLETSIFFLGAKTGQELWDEYFKATCLLLPSRSEPWGLVVNEALACGTPVVVSDCCGCVPELVVTGTTGFVARNDDVDDFTEKMEKVISLSIDVAGTARNCIDQVAPYSAERVAARIYEGCLSTLGRRG